MGQTIETTIGDKKIKCTATSYLQEVAGCWCGRISRPGYSLWDGIGSVAFEVLLMWP